MKYSDLLNTAQGRPTATQVVGFIKKLASFSQLELDPAKLASDVSKNAPANQSADIPQKAAYKSQPKDLFKVPAVQKPAIDASATEPDITDNEEQ